MNTSSNAFYFEGYVREVIYDESHWKIFREKRLKSIRILEALRRCGINLAIAHGSIARGDIDIGSDVDVSLLKPYPYGITKLCLENSGFKIYNIVIIQPTPKHTPKIYLYLDHLEEQSVSIPIVELEPIEIEYYRFSGMVTLDDLYMDRRVCGVNKKLMFIEPTDRGHREFPVIGYEGYIAKRLGVSISVVMDRVEALTRRIREGHTGLFIEREIPYFEEIEKAIDDLCNENTLFKRRVERYGLCT